LTLERRDGIRERSNRRPSVDIQRSLFVG
jgi:hypothetical protein